MPTTLPSLMSLDPTGTGLLRRDWERETRKRNDDFLKLIAFLLLLHWKQRLDLDGFLRDLQSHYDMLFLHGVGASRYWFTSFIERAYRAGVLSAWDQVRGFPSLNDVGGKGARSAFAMTVLHRMQESGSVSNFITRSVLSYESVRASILSAIGNLVTSDVGEGDKPGTVARDIRSYLSETLPKRQVLTTEHETTSAFAEGQLDAFDALGVKKVGADVEFTTVAGRGASEKEMIELRVCPKCRALSGQVFTVKEAHGVIPRHLRCRCKWTPLR